MRTILVTLMIAGASVAPKLQAQVDYNARVGVTWSTALIRDDIVGEVETQPKLAPTVVLGASLPIAPLYRAGLEVGLSSSGYQATESDISRDLGTLRTGSVTLGLEGPISPSFRWRAGAGLLGYLPSDDRGIFLRGGTTRFLAGAGVDYSRAVSSQWEMIVSLRYDFHRFTTEELQARGFSQSQGVQRISATVGIGRGGR
ncbi:MAG TPA: hypothetical protein VJ808_09830 [Gemmatimonadales bacterium]|nr:hypothetical protein [Gemmatimonadales bacterium]